MCVCGVATDNGGAAGSAGGDQVKPAHKLGEVPHRHAGCAGRAGEDQRRQGEPGAAAAAGAGRGSAQGPG